MTERCPLCRSTDTIKKETIPVERINSIYQTSFDVAVYDKITEQNIEKVHRYRCRNCELQFFEPTMLGTEVLYAALSQYDWYLQESKWGFDVALESIGQTDSVLEIGCGSGNFLTRLRETGVDDAVGIDINSSAVREAKNVGHDVYQSDIESFVESDMSFDVVCSFQTLEHVADPRSFLEASLSALGKNGTLLFTVPNSGGFLSTIRTPPLNIPPHHQTRWTQSVAENVSEFLPLELTRVETETLSSKHKNWYVREKLLTELTSVLGERIVRRIDTPPVSKLVSGVARFGYRPLLELNGHLSRVDGHTLYAEYETE